MSLSNGEPRDRKVLWKGRNIVRLSISFIVFALLLSAQPPAGTYPLFLASKKPLKVGTPVWTNMGDSECVYPRNGDHPKADDKCMRGYFKGKVVKASRYLDHIVHEVHWIYTIEFTIKPPNRPASKITRDNYFDEAYVIYNLPEKWAEYSRYFVALNW